MDLLILTCTVVPTPQRDLVISDPELRLNQYIKAISRWIASTRKHGVEVWVLENSNSIDLLVEKIEIQQIDSQRVRFIGTNKDEISETQGKSAGEFLMIKSVLPEILQSNHKKIAKVTGRLFVSNWKKCVFKSGEFDFMSARFWHPKHLIDTRFFYASVDFFNEVFSKEVDFNPRNISITPIEMKPYLSMEHFLSERTLLLESHDWLVKSFPVVPIYRGVSASTGKTLDQGSSLKKIMAANILRKIAIKLLAGSTP